MSYLENYSSNLLQTYIWTPQAMTEPVCNILYFFIAFPIWESYLFLKNTQSFFDQEELLKITRKFLYTGFWAC